VEDRPEKMVRLADSVNQCLPVLIITLTIDREEDLPTDAVHNYSHKKKFQLDNSANSRNLCSRGFS